MAKSEAETDVTHVDLVLQQWKKPVTIDKIMFFSIVSQRTEISSNWSGEQAGYGIGFSFLMDVILYTSSSKTATKALDRDFGFV